MELFTLNFANQLPDLTTSITLVGLSMKKVYSIAVFIFILLFFDGCGESLNRGTTPEIVVEPTFMIMRVPELYSLVVDHLIIHNEGGVPLIIRNIEIIDENSLSVDDIEEFQIRFLQTIELEPGQEYVLEVSYAAENQEFDFAKIHIVTNDPDNPDLYVDVQSSPQYASIMTEPESMLEFQRIPINQTWVQNIEVTNISATTKLEISNLCIRPNIGEEACNCVLERGSNFCSTTLENPIFYFSEEINFNDFFTMEPGESKNIKMSYSPDDEIPDDWLLYIYNNDGVPGKRNYLIRLKGVPCFGGEQGCPSRCKDNDEDGYVFNCPEATDCDDNNSAINPQAEEICDGFDNNCDDFIDEIFNVGDPCSNGVGECIRTGEFICNEDHSGTFCNAVSGEAIVEICNGLDDDCDGVIDEDDSGNLLSQECYTGTANSLDIGVCEGGAQVCRDGLWGECGGEVTPGVELCDGLDNNCDGVSDETFDVGAPCSSGVGECMQTGEFICKNDHSGVMCSVAAEEPLTEICNGLDDDCDGVIDEGASGRLLVQECYTGLPSSHGVGICTGGTLTCREGLWGECEGEVTPDLEVCDGLDNDCDGVSDIEGQMDCAEGELCMEGECVGLAFASCVDILERYSGSEDGVYEIVPDSSISGTSLEVYCNMTLDNGGWTLVAVSSDDGQNTWTWNQRHLWDTDTSTFGSLSAINRDFKSPALHTLNFNDLLFIHSPSQLWASYHDVDNGSRTLGDFIGSIGETICWSREQGYPLRNGTISVRGYLCSTSLFFNAEDHDGLEVCTAPMRDNSYGPTWSVSRDVGCPFDDPGFSGSLGPNSLDQSIEYNSRNPPALGFGNALRVNTGVSRSGENYVSVFVR